MFRTFAVVVLLASAPVLAAGFLFGDNGVKASMQGGAFTGQADDLTALQYNPAGLAQLEGLQVLLDGELLFHRVTFHRTYEMGSGPPACDPSLPTCTATQSNKAGPGFLPFAAVSYGLKVVDRQLTFALGVYGPPAVMSYKFADAPLDDPNLRTLAPQRYALISSNVLLAFPSLSASFEVLPRRVYVGAVLQMVLGSFAFKQNATSMPIDAHSFADNIPSLDSTLALNLQARLGVTGVFGVLVKPLDSLSLGVSFRPPVPVHASGPLDITLGPGAQSLGAKVVTANPQTDLDLTLPMDLRFGARWQTPLRGLGVNADFVYQGWNSVDALVVTPKDVELQIGNGTPTKVGQVRIEKQWKPSYSVRFGAGYDINRWVSAAAGFNFETGTYDSAYTSIDFIHPTRIFLTGGATAHVGPVDVLLGVAFTPAVSSTLTQSNVRAANTFTDPNDPTTPKGEIVGLGDYTSGGFSLLFGVRGHFLEPKPAPVPVEAPAIPALPTAADAPVSPPTP